MSTELKILFMMNLKFLFSTSEASFGTTAYVAELFFIGIEVSLWNAYEFSIRFKSLLLSNQFMHEPYSTFRSCSQVLESFH